MPNIQAWLGENAPEQFVAMEDNANAMNRFPYKADVSGLRGSPRVFGRLYSGMPFRLDLPTARADTSLSEGSGEPITPIGYYPQGFDLQQKDQITFNGEVYQVVSVLTDQTPLADCRVNLQRINER